MKFRIVLCVFIFTYATNSNADSIAREIGKAIGDVAGGVAEAGAAPLREGVINMTPVWETIEPRSKEACFEETGGVVNNYFLRCRNGRQEQVRYLKDGTRTVLSERAIPSHPSR